MSKLFEICHAINATVDRVVFYQVADPSAAKVDVRIPIGHGGVADISATSSKPPSGASKHKSSKHGKAAPAWK